ncbi:MAG: hypothetical protein IJC71_01840 [Clostridia bacterium]|nr:hypothetical protein [Clostridia bacterium]
MGKIDCSCGKMLYREENGVFWFWCKSCWKEVPFVFVDESGKPVKVTAKNHRRKSRTFVLRVFQKNPPFAFLPDGY